MRDPKTPLVCWFAVGSLAMFAALVWSCTPPNKSTPAPQQSAPQSKGLLVGDVQAQKDRVDGPYRLKLDVRFPQAFRALHQLVAAGVSPVFRSELEKKHQIVFLDVTRVADLGEHAEFSQAREALGKFAETLAPSLVKAGARVGGEGALATPTLEPIEISFERLQSVAGLRAAELLSPDTAPRLAKALANLCFQATDLMGTADELCSRALAFSVLADKVSPGAVAEPLALLAHAFGYEAEAEKLAQALPEEAPLRAFISGNDAALARAALSSESTFAARLLWLIHLNKTGSAIEEARYRAQYFRTDQFTASVLAARLRAPHGMNQPGFVPALPSLLLLEASALTRDAQALRFRMGVRSSGVRAEELAELSVGIERLLAPKGNVLLAYDSVLERLSARTVVADALSPAATRSLLSTFMFSALRIRQPPAERGDASTPVLQGENLGAFSEFSRWRAVLLGPKVPGKASELLARARGLRELGGVAWEPLYASLSVGAPPGSAAHYALARALFAHLDSRPAHRWLAAGAASTALSDSLLHEEFLAAAVRASPNSRFSASLEFAGLVQAPDLLLGFSESASASPGERAQAVWELSRIGQLPPARVQEGFEHLLSTTEDDWLARKVYVEFRRSRGEFDAALDLARSWLFPEPRSGGARLLEVRAEAASILMEQGKLPEGWKLIEPSVDTLHTEVLQVASQILVRMKNVDRAVALATADRERNGRGSTALSNYVELCWRAGRYDAAAKELRSASHELSDANFRSSVSRRFFRALGEDPEATKLAFEALREVKLAPTALAEFAEAFARTKPSLAFELLQRITVSGSEQLTNLLRAYELLKQTQGEAEAATWIAEKVPPKARQALLELAFMRAHPELLWSFSEPRGLSQGERDVIWVLRAASLLRQGQTNTPNWKKVSAYFEPKLSGEVNDSGLSIAIGRYLVGSLAKESLLALAQTQRSACRIAFYLGLKAHADDKLEAAHTWYRAAAETGLVEVAECRFARAQLQAWQNAGKSLRLQRRGP